jgi:hypothetical protein
MLLTLDASVERMTEVSSGFSHRLQAELATVEGRVATAHRLGLELQAASRTAENVSAQLERLLRQHRQAEVSRASTTPRKRAEPKGFAERFGRADGATSGGHAKVPADAAAVARTEDELQVAAL